MTSTQLQAGSFVTQAVRLVRPLAEGGMGRVWLAEHLGLETEVVVKLMAEEMAARPDGAERFAREAAIAAAIKSPHAVQVFDHGVTVEGTPYIVMERLEGKDLAAHLAAHGRMDPADVVALVLQVGKALAKAHKASIVHRDIKPENIFLCDTEGREPFAKLLDFGTARRDTPSGARTTVPGQILGTPHYMSPEQSVGGDVDERSDLWSLGVVTFEALTGDKPFDFGTVGAIAIAVRGPLPRMTDRVAGLPPALDDWFARACAQAPTARFATVREMTDALALAVTGSSPVDQATESLCLTRIDRSGASTPARPVTRRIEPLSASLPDRAASHRPTRVAAGLVFAAAAAAMIAIVVHRSPAGEAAAEAPPAAEPPAAARAAEPATAETSAAADAPALPLRAAAAQQPAPRRSARSPAAASSLRPDPLAAHARAKPPTARRAGQRDGGAAAAREDDDLLRLTSAAAKHAEPASAPPASAPPASAPPAPAPPASAPPAPAAAPVSPEPRPTPAPDRVAPSPDPSGLPVSPPSPTPPPLPPPTTE